MTKMNELYDKVAASSQLQAEVAEIMKDATADNAADTQEKIIAFAKKLGYDVTAEEVSAFFGGMLQGQQELSDTELDTVAGGKTDDQLLAGILGSIFSMGLTCALSSAECSKNNRQCFDDPEC